MYKKVLALALVCCLVAVPAYAHLTGAFANFLAIVYDEQTIEQLREEMANTKLEIEALTPVVEKAGQAFRADQEVSIEQLQFYSEVGLDTWLALMQQGTDIVDILGSQSFMSTKIDTYLFDLNELYLQYKQLVLQKESLEGHQHLLEAIEKNLQARQAFLDENAGLELEVIANYLDIDWTAEVEEHIIADLQADADAVNEQLLEWLAVTDELPFALSEEWLNERSEARYYFRSDHVYIEYELEYAHVLVLGQVLQNEQGTGAKLVIEAGFYNGFFLPEELLVELPSFEIDYEQLQTVEPIVNPYIIQKNGQLDVYSK